MTTTWHADAETMTAYADGRLDAVRAGSLEAHVLSCDSCREGLAASVPTASLDPIWADVIDELDAPRPGPIERLLVAMRVSDHTARLLSATASLRVSWLLAETVALTFAVVAANSATGVGADLALFLFLVVAALLPVAGVAVAFGRGVDPSYEVVAAAPMRADRLLLLRASAVLTTSVIITGCAALAMPGLDAIAAAWLLPALALTLATLTLGTWLRPFVAAVTVALSWVAVAAGAAVAAHDRLAVFRPAAQVACTVAIAMCAVVLAQRHTVYGGRIAR